MNVTIQLHGIPDQERTKELLRVIGDVAAVKDDLAESGVSYYHMKRDGRRCDAHGNLCPWDFWRLRVEEISDESSARKRS